MADNEALLMAAWKGNKKFRREGKILKAGVRVYGVWKQGRKRGRVAAQSGALAGTRVLGLAKKYVQKEREKRRKRDVQKEERACARGKYGYG